MSRLPIAALAALVLMSVDARAAEPTATPQPAKSAAEQSGFPLEVSLTNTKRLDFVSGVNGHAYSIEVYLPDAPPPPAGYSVIYVFDGDLFFSSFAEAVRINAPRTIVVGLGYPHDPAWVARILGPGAARVVKTSPTRAFLGATQQARDYDLTPPTGDAALKQMNSGSGQGLTKDQVGGGDVFLKIIETEVKPRVYALAQVNKDDQVLYGHSLGGLEVLEALFTEPQAFRTFVASSPSIHWANREVLANEPAFAAQVKEGKAAPRVLIAVGGEEQISSKDHPDTTRMVDNACELAHRLKALHGAKGYEVADCTVAQGLDHGASPWASMAHAMAFAFPR